jgi:hypothetical protein
MRRDSSWSHLRVITNLPLLLVGVTCYRLEDKRDGGQECYRVEDKRDGGQECYRVEDKRDGGQELQLRLQSISSLTCRK